MLHAEAIATHSSHLVPNLRFFMSVPRAPSDFGRGRPLQTVGTRRQADASARDTNRCDPRRSFVAQTEEPCPDHPLDQSKSDQTLAGLLAHGSSLDIRPSRISAVAALVQWLHPPEEDAMYVSLAAYSCRDSLGFGRASPTPCSLLSPSRDTSAIIVGSEIPLRPDGQCVPGKVPIGKTASAFSDPVRL